MTRLYRELQIPIKCTEASKQNDDNIVKAYERMKKSLEREYKELGTYLSHYDFSKCMPIPRIKTDEKMVENYYKSLHIEPKTVIINSINNRNIKSIHEVQPTVSCMFLDRRGRFLKLNILRILLVFLCEIKFHFWNFEMNILNVGFL